MKRDANRLVLLKELDSGKYRRWIDEYVEFLQTEVARHGKQMVGWEEITAIPLRPDSLVQHWLRPAVAGEAGPGTRFECDTKIGPVTLTDVMEITRWVPGKAIGVRHSGVVTGTGEFTLEFGNYTVRLTTPADHVVGATGVQAIISMATLMIAFYITCAVFIVVILVKPEGLLGREEARKV